MGRNISNQRLKCITHFSKNTQFYFYYIYAINYRQDLKAKTDCTVSANKVSCRSVILYNNFRKTVTCPNKAK